MKRQGLKQIQVSAVGMTKIEGTVDFFCTNCEAMVSLEDETETVHSIVKTNVRNISSHWRQ